jgi:hypothetical protein
MVYHVPNNSNPAYEAGRSGASLSRLASPLILWAGIFFLSCSGFLLYTLVLEEDYLGPKMELLKENAPIIGVPALIGLALAAIAVKRSRKR